MERIEVPIDKEISKFEQFLDDKSNHRILFSGIFGSGKTYFLNKFFEKKNDKYEVFYISPVNYCISKNKDVLKLLQYDLLVEVMLKNLLPETEEKFTKWETVIGFAHFNCFNILKDVVSHCGEIGKKISDVYDSLAKWVHKYEEFSKSINKGQTETVNGLMNELAKDLEISSYTELINNIISDVDKESVLIIDDLDRIDPEHIFRLLNVFSAQLSDYFSSHSFAENEKNNKFGFSKVIFVCDIDNIRNIFHAKYGQNTDFSGYIDKFYSTEPYMWNNNEMLLDTVYKYINSIHSENKDAFSHYLCVTMRMLVNYNILSIRKFVDKENRNWIPPYRKTPVMRKDINLYSAIIVEFVLFMFGTKKDAIEVLKQHKEEIELKTDCGVLDILMPLLSWEKYSISKDEEKLVAITYTSEELNINIEYGLFIENTEKCAKIHKINDLKGREKKQIPFFQMLGIAIENYCLLVQDGEIYMY